MLARFSELAYGATKAYRADAREFRAYLFPFEERVITEFFPPPPARVLVGGAGGGREAFALAGMGYQVVAFDPSPPLAASLAARGREAGDVAAYRAAYEDLPRLFPARPGGPSTLLDQLEPFAASIVGWGSFSHLTREDARLSTLSSFGAVTSGPILVSLLAMRAPGARAGRRLARIRERLPRRPGRQVGDFFSVSIGYFHPIDQPELQALAEAAGLEVRYVNFEQRETNWPHAVLAPRATAH